MAIFVSGTELSGGGGGLYVSMAHFQSNYDQTITTSEARISFEANEYISDSNDFSIDTNKEVVTLVNAGRYEITWSGMCRTGSNPTNITDFSNMNVNCYKNSTTFIQEGRTEFGPISKVEDTANNSNDSGKTNASTSFVYNFAANDTIEWKISYFGNATSIRITNRNLIIKRLS
jgi:hypothetical protein